MTRAKFIACLALAFVVLFFGLCALVAATSPCSGWRWDGPVPYLHGFRGWRGDVKCYNGNVIDYR